jgi:1-acyl-sn-glycerol-3-phosphate acyltransferase
MIATLRFWFSLLGATLHQGARILGATYRGVKFVPGNVYDQAGRDWCRSLLRANRIRVKSDGLDKLERLGSCVYAVNHESWVDIWAACDVLPGSLRFMAKKELFKVPIFGPSIRAARHFTVDRGDRLSALGAYQEAAAAIREGLRAVVFPEGTRSRDGRLLPFKKGPFVLAIAAQVPVVPVFVEGGFAILPKGALHPRPGEVTVRIGDPIPTEGLSYEDRDALSRKCRAAMVGLGAVNGSEE